MPPALGVLNAANLCPAPAPVLEAMYRSTKDIDGDPSFDNLRKMSAEGRDATAGLGISARHAGRDRAHANTSEANNMVSSGSISSGDEVVLCR